MILYVAAAILLLALKLTPTSSPLHTSITWSAIESSGLTVTVTVNESPIQFWPSGSTLYTTSIGILVGLDQASSNISSSLTLFVTIGFPENALKPLLLILVMLYLNALGPSWSFPK